MEQDGRCDKYQYASIFEELADADDFMAVVLAVVGSAGQFVVDFRARESA